MPVKSHHAFHDRKCIAFNSVDMSHKWELNSFVSVLLLQKDGITVKG